jgi:hypothetical protein
MEIPYRSILIGGHLLLAAWFGMALASSNIEASGYGPVPESGAGVAAEKASVIEGRKLSEESAEERFSSAGNF